MRERKSAKLNQQQQQQQVQDHQNGHLSPFKLGKLLDPDASWDKVRAISDLVSVPLVVAVGV